jgi:hypothetical protein
MTELSVDTIEKLRRAVVAETASWHDKPLGEVAPWPVLGFNLAVFEFIRARGIDPKELQASVAELEQHQVLPAGDARRFWAEQLKKGYELFRDSGRVHAVEYGDPSRRDGVPPNEPGMGLRFYIDLDRGRVFVRTCPIALPESDSSVVPDRERRHRIALEPALRELVLKAEGTSQSFAPVARAGGWPIVVVDGLVHQASSVEPVPTEVLELLLREAGRAIPYEPPGVVEGLRREQELYRRLLASGPVYRVWFNRPPYWRAPGAIVWVAPEKCFSVLNYWLTSEPGDEPKNRRRVLEYGARDASTILALSALEQGEAKRLEAEHFDRLVAELPGLASSLGRIRTGGYVCWSCGGTSRDVRQVVLGVDGGVRIRCGTCRSRATLNPPNYDWSDASLEGRRDLNRPCPHCGKALFNCRVIRRAPGDPWSGVCDVCGCSFPFDVAQA